MKEGPKQNRRTVLMFCETHRKQGYSSKRWAKHAIRTRHTGDKGMSAYTCADGNGIWHIGHLPKAVVRGQIGREDIYNGR